MKNDTVGVELKRRRVTDAAKAVSKKQKIDAASASDSMGTAEEVM
jgi:hypothetical protein